MPARTASALPSPPRPPRPPAESRASRPVCRGHRRAVRRFQDAVKQHSISFRRSREPSVAKPPRLRAPPLDYAGRSLTFPISTRASRDDAGDRKGDSAAANRPCPASWREKPAPRAEAGGPQTAGPEGAIEAGRKGARAVLSAREAGRRDRMAARGARRGPNASFHARPSHCADQAASVSKANV